MRTQIVYPALLPQAQGSRYISGLVHRMQRQYKAENRAKKEILRANIGQMTFDEIVKNYRSLDRASLIIIKKALIAVLKAIEKKLK